jgi:phosphate transport system permease protein
MSADATPATPSATQAARLELWDVCFKVLCRAAAILIIVVSVLLLVVLIERSLLAFTRVGLGFLVQTDWNPNSTPPIYGSLTFVWGTIATSAIAMALALPLGVGTASYLSEIATPALRKTASFFIEMLAAIPSVIYGFWGMYVLAPLVGRLFRLFGSDNVDGLGILSAGLVLAIMILPYISAISYDVLQAVPRSQREGSLALGATRWQTIWGVVLPYARPGIVAGAFLALGRALGETMAVTMLIGNTPVISFWPSARGHSIASKLATGYAEAQSRLDESVLVELGLILLLVTVAINTLARLMLSRVGSGKPIFPFLVRSSSISPLAALTAPASSPRPWMTAHAADRVMSNLLGGCVALTMALLVFILGYLLYKGVGSLDWALFTQLPPTRSEASGGGLAHAIVGSLQIVGLATVFAVPIGLLAAIYLSEYRPGALSYSTRFIAEQLGGVPSIIVGIFAWGMFQLAGDACFRWFGVKPRLFGYSGVFALAVMMLPIILRAAEESLKLVPSTLRIASYALGASQSQTILRVVVPAALPAIITAIFLSVARIAGETAPLLLTAGRPTMWHESLGDYVATLPAWIYEFAMQGSENQQRIAWGGAFVLMALVLLLNFGVRFVTGARVVQASRAE